MGERVDRALVYATYNGVFNNTNGIGRQTKTMLSTLARNHRAWCREVAPFDFHLVAPLPLPDHWGYSAEDLAYAHAVTDAAGGRVHYCPLPTDPARFWSRPTWEALSISCAAVVCGLSHQYRKLVVLAVDTPYLGVGHALRDVGSILHVGLDVLLLFYSTSLILDRLDPMPDRQEWEHVAIAAANGSPTTRVADIGEFMSRHLVDEYGLDSDRLVSFPSSLDVSHEEFSPMSPGHARARASAYGVPLDRPIVLAFGRADPIKGFDVLIRALAPLREQVHLVLIAVPYSPVDPIVSNYMELLQSTRVRATCLWRYNRELPRSLCQLPETRVVVCPSLGEPLSNIPFEVALWARYDGPVLVCPAADGYVEQVSDGVTGFTYERARGADGLTEGIQRALTVDSQSRFRIRQTAYDEALAKCDARVNVASMLRHYWL